MTESRMAIPDFNNQGLLPPHNGNPADMSNTSPYPATTVELCRKFGTTAERCEILKGFLQLRELMCQLEVLDGFQWVNGRFMEQDIGGRKAPDHIHVVTFCKPSPLIRHPDYADLAKPLKHSKSTRDRFLVQHFIVSLDIEDRETGKTDPKKLDNLINRTRHFAGLLSHESESGSWKGLLRIELNTSDDDHEALRCLNEQERS